MWFVVYIEGPLLLFQTSRWFSWPTFSKWLFNIFRLRGAQNVGVYTMWHQIPSASGPYPQLRSLRHSPYLTYCFRATGNGRVKRNFCWVFRPFSYTTRKFEKASLLVTVVART